MSPGAVILCAKSLHGLAALTLGLALGACAQLAPLQRPPLNPGDDLTAVSTRAEAVQRFGPPDEVRSSDVGPVLVYRRAVVVDVNPNRYYGENRGDQLNQYELVLLYVDAEGRIVRRAIEPE
jgi:hypothetical protein